MSAIYFFSNILDRLLLGFLSMIDMLQCIVLMIVWIIVMLLDQLWHFVKMMATVLNYLFWAFMLIYFAPVILIALLVAAIS